MTRRRATGLRVRAVAVGCAAFLLAAVHAQAQSTPANPPAAGGVVRPSAPETLETATPSLAELLRQQGAAPSLEHERRLGYAYLRAGVLDTAFDHFQMALRLDPHDPAANESVAKIWRDWGFSGRGLPHAYTAVFWSPDSASTTNTLGTLLLDLGYFDAARQRFEAARRLEPTAAYPLNNLCYLSLREQQPEEAVTWCRSAADADPASEQVRTNLALALTLHGDVDQAIAVLQASPDKARAAYNQAVLLLAVRNTSGAQDALMRARIADPTFAPALRLLGRIAFRRTGH